MAIRASVALVRTSPTTVLHDYERVSLLANIQDALAANIQTVLCPAERRFPFPAANTTPWQLEGIVRALHTCGYHDLAWLSRAGSPLQSGDDHDLNGYLPVLRSLDVPVCLDSEQLWGANAVLLPTLRTDAAVTLGGALWCAARAAMPGCGSAAAGRLPFVCVEALAILRQRCAGVFAAMDGTTAGNGPLPEVRNVLLASADPVALDAVAARLLGFDPLRDIASVRLAHERGLGIGDPRQIEVTGDLDLARERWNFSPGGPARAAALLGRVARSKRLAHAFDMLAALYQDYYRWPFEQRWVFESWLYSTEWGRLFARYQRLNLTHVKAEDYR